MLTLYRRHLETCPHKAKGREWIKCDCPIHCDGMVSGRRIRQSMSTVNWARAMRRLGEIEDDAAAGKARKSVSTAAENFLTHREVEESTLTKYRRIMARLTEFCERREISTVDRIELEHLDDYRTTRQINKLSWSKELQLLRQFFEFCRRRKWCFENVAKDMKMPPNPKPRERAPYTPQEYVRILAACDTFGKNDYERRRARAIILLMRHFGLRVSDVATLERNRVKNGEIFITAMKNGKQLWLPLSDYPEVQFALEALPLPQGADDNCPYFFWTGKGSKFGHIKTVVRTLQAVFRESGVERASSHRFRHTLATEILANGGTAEDAANILGDSPHIILKHYSKWSPDYQSRTVSLLRRVHGTQTAREENGEISPLLPASKLVLEVGVEKAKRKKPC